MAVTSGAEAGVRRRCTGRAFGITLGADFRLPGVLEAGDPGQIRRADVRHVDLSLQDSATADAGWPAGTAARTFELRGPDGSPVFTIDRHQEVGYRVWIAGLGRCFIGPEGDRIRCVPPDRPNRWELLIGQGLPIAAALQGLEVLHASAVRLGSIAIAFVARAGTGKTSLALHLLGHGAEFLADDVVALEADGDTLLTHPGIGLANAPRTEWEALASAGIDIPRPTTTTPKHHVPLAMPEAPVPLGAVYFLERTRDVEEPEIVAIDAPEPGLLLGSTFVAHVPTAARLITQLDICSRIARTVPLFRVRAPAEGGAADLAARIAGHIGTNG